MTMRTWSIAHRIAERAAAQPWRPALTVDGETLTYAELWHLAARLAKQLPTGREGETTSTAVMAHRRLSSYLGPLACLIGGHAWVPLHVAHPVRRNLAVLRKSRAARIVCGPQAAASLQLLRAEDPSLAFDVIDAPDRRPDVPASAVHDPLPAPLVAASRWAYVLFTSGSTGEPKGVPITHGALTTYLDNAARLVPGSPEDRCSQTFELTFDLSIHDLLTCWTAGSHLVVPTRGELAKPAEYLRRHAITRWFSVPSLAYQMRLQGDLVPGAFPSLRTSLFCGEALPVRLAQEWALAAPNSVVENWYGPTEATIACARYVMPRPSRGEVATQDLAPIGDAFDGMTLSIHAPDLSPVPDGTPGELLLRGAQLSEGYLDEPERNVRTFVRLPDDPGGSVAYRTGDRAVREPGGPVRFLGRLDDQVKVRGFRLELTEIEAVLRTATGGGNAVALSWPPGEPSGRFVVAAVEAATVDEAAIAAAAARSLPDYMVPAKVVALPSFPVNASGKADRHAIADYVAARLRNSTNPADLEPLTPAGRRLMRAVLAASPTLPARDALEAETLMAAGMDSLSFIALTADIERLYERALDQDEVVRLSLLSFHDIVAYLEHRRTRRAWSRVVERLFRRGVTGDRLDRRTNRALQFVTRFPDVLAGTQGRALVLALGSSGTFRAIEPNAFEAEARRRGFEVRCYNAGLAGVSLAGLARVADWLAQTCRHAGVRPALVLYELDPAQVSVLPGRGDAQLPDAFFSGELKPYPDGHFTPDFEWSAGARGAWVHDLPATKSKRTANWERERDTEVARIYAGDVPFVPGAVDSWLTGLRALQGVAARVAVFVHPVNAVMMQELPARFRGDRFDALLRRLAAMEGVELIAPDGFALEDDDYLDINHVNPGSGRPKLSRQLVQRLFHDSRASAASEPPPRRFVSR
jgi:amino acid adenylation domain-containing protein